jgi:hypothetical protein
VSESNNNRSIPFLAADRSPSMSREVNPPPEGSHRVLATLVVGDESYRLFADLIVSAGTAHLRLHRFDLPNGDDWFVERKVSIPVTRAEVAPLEAKVNGTELELCTPVRLDEVRAAAFFGRWGPPST